jgi:hypothetical protein
MDYFSDDSAHSSFSLNEPADSTPEDKITRKRWARGVLAFYLCLFLAGATMIARQTPIFSSGTEQHVSLQTDVQLDH